MSSKDKWKVEIAIWVEYVVIEVSLVVDVVTS